MIGIITLFDEPFREIAEQTLPNKQAYGEKHAYPLIIESALRDSSRPASWSKVLAILSHLPRYDWLFWSDTDALFANDEIKLESFADEDFDLILPTDFGGRINCSHFLIRNCEWSIQFLTDVYLQDQFINHRFWEQAAIMHLMDGHKDHIKTLDDSVMKSGYAYYKPGDFTVHFGGGNKLDKMKDWKEKYG